MRIRLMGTPEEITAILNALATVLDINEVSNFIPNRGNSKLGRVYLDVGGIRATRATATRTGKSRTAIEVSQPSEINIVDGE